MSEEEERLVFPGDEVGMAEEWLSGEGTYEDEGKIHAAHFGIVKYDEDDLEAKVEAINSIVEVKEGDIVYGVVEARKNSMVVISIEMVEGSSRGVKEDVEASLHISKVSDDYTEELEEEYLVGDIVRAKVVQVEPTLRLSTIGGEYGVVKGYCSRCRKDMKYKKNKLYCPRCDIYEDRKISKVYGKIKLKRKDK